MPGPYRPTARQIVREDAERYGWEQTLDLPYHDVFRRGNRRVITHWNMDNPQRVACGSYEQVDDHLTRKDTGVLCIVRAREWLSREVSA